MPRRVGAYAKLLANYANDDAIIAAGEKAELLFVRGLAFCSTSDSDGYITDGQVVRVVGAGMRDAQARANALVREGLWERADGGYQVRSWTKIHESAEEKGRARRTDRERKRRPKSSDSDESPDGDEPESDPHSERNADRKTSDSLDCFNGSSPTGRQSNPIQSRAAIPAGSAARIVTAYVAACRDHGIAAPEESQAQVERSARSLLAQGYPAADITTAARNAAVGGWTNLATQLQRDTARASPTATGQRPSTNDQRAAAALAAGHAVSLERTQFDRRQLP